MTTQGVFLSLDLDRKKCSKCNVEKHLTQFYKNVRQKDGLTTICKECTSIQNKKYNQKNKDKKRAYWIKTSTSDPLLFWAKTTLKSHVFNGYKVLVTVESLVCLAKHAKECAICGCELNWEYGVGHKWNGPSLDRVKNEDHIDSTNIAIICKSCNVTKRDRTMEEFITYCQNVIKRSSSLPQGCKILDLVEENEGLRCHEHNNKVIPILVESSCV